MAMLTAKPMADDHDGTLANMRPDLPQRVVDATEKVAACTMNDEQPNISAYLASVAMADAIKEGELEVARIDAEFRAQMKAEREKWEAEQHACQLANEAQVQKFGEERAEYERRAAKEREQLATARAEIDKRRAEVQQARAELDQARADFKQKKSELEARVKEIDRHAHDLEKQKRDLEKHSRDLEKRKLELEKKNRELTEAAAVAAASASPGAETSMDSLMARIQHHDEVRRPTVAVDVIAETSGPTVLVEAMNDEDITEQEFAAAEADVPRRSRRGRSPAASKASKTFTRRGRRSKRRSRGRCRSTPTSRWRESPTRRPRCPSRKSERDVRAGWCRRGSPRSSSCSSARRTGSIIAVRAPRVHFRDPTRRDDSAP